MNDRQRRAGRRAGWGAITALASLPALAIGGFGFTSSSSAAPHAQAADDDAAKFRDEHDLCQGGAVGEVDVAITGGDVVGTGVHRGLRLSLDVTNRSREDREVSYAVEVLDVSGKALARPAFAAPRSIRRSERATSLPFETPRGLPDGYYRVLVTTLTTGPGGHELADTREIYIRSSDGAPSVTSHDDWYENSGIQRHGMRL